VGSDQLGAEEAGTGPAHGHRGMHRAHAEGRARAAGRRDGQGDAGRPHAQGAAAQAAAARGRVVPTPPPPAKEEPVTIRSLTLAAALALACTAGGAQTVWRCGNSYSTQPCAGGSSFEVTPAPSREEALRAEKAAKIDAQRAAELEKARLAQEKNAPRAIVIGPVEAPAEEVAEKKERPTAKGKPQAFKASAAAPAKKPK